MSTVYYRKEISMDVAEDPNYEKKAFERDNLVRSEQYTLGVQVVKRALAASGTHTVDSSVITSPKLLYIEVSGTCTINMNSANTTFSLSPSAGQIASMWLDGASFTQCAIQNTSGAEIDVTVMVGG